MVSAIHNMVTLNSKDKNSFLETKEICNVRFSKRPHSESGSDAGSVIGRRKKKANFKDSRSESGSPRSKSGKGSGSDSDSGSPKPRRRASGSESEGRENPKEEDIFGDDLSIR